MGAKIANNRSARKYGPGASKTVAKVMHEFKHGALLSGRSKTRVTNPKQAIAIGLSEARQAGAKVSPEPVSSIGRRTLPPISVSVAASRPDSTLRARAQWRPRRRVGPQTRSTGIKKRE